MYGVRYFNELTNMAILVEEVGELARIMGRVYGEQSFKDPKDISLAKEKLGDEIADIIFVLGCISNQTGIDLDDAIEKNFRKKTERDQDRHQKNEKLKG
jgi:NTP pyrophosphatase (non-canonical NTP hydrolase)